MRVTSLLRRALAGALLLATTSIGTMLTLVPAASASSSTTVTVEAGASPPSYNATGVTLPAGAQVSVTATGAWNVSCTGATPTTGNDSSGPNGLAGKYGSYLDPTAVAGMLIGSLDGGATWFAIGAGPTVVNGPGTLILAVNDLYGSYTDDCGSVAAVITNPVMSLFSGNGTLGNLDSRVQASLDGTTWAPAYVVTPNVYASAISGTQYVAQGGIDPNGGGGLPESGSDSAPALDFYRIAFTLPTNYSTPSISGLMRADNAAVAYLNGVSIGAQPIADTGNNWAAPGTPFSSSNASLFQSGVNYLSFDLYNMGGPQGLDFQAMVTFAPVPADTTPPSANPVVTPAPNAAGWNNTNVTVNWNWTDSGSGIDPNNCQQMSTSSGQGTITLSSTCKDLAGNSASDAVTVKVDTTPPVVTFSGNAGTYSVDQSVSISCSAYDPISGVASETCADISGPAWSFGLGPHMVSASAIDNAGNVGSASTLFTVTVNEASLCRLVQEFTSSSGIAKSLCVKLDAAANAAARGQARTQANDLSAFEHEVVAQSGKAFTTAQARLLIEFAGAL